MNKEKPFGYENMNLKGWNGPPYTYEVWINNKKRTMSGFSVQHIYDQLSPAERKLPSKIKKVKD